MWWKVAKVKFVAHLSPKLWYQICRDRTTMTPVLAWSNINPVWTHTFFQRPTAFCTWRIGLISVSINWKMFRGLPFPYVPKWYQAFLTRYDPPNSKMVISGCFLDFSTNKKYVNGKIKRCTIWSAIDQLSNDTKFIGIGTGSAELWPGEWFKTRKHCINIISCSD